MTLLEWRKKIAEALSGFENPSLEAKWLIEEALQKKLTLDGTYTPTLEEEVRLLEWLNRRLTSEPLSRIKGMREFWSLPFYINEHTLDPRPETEHIIEEVLKWINHHPEYRHCERSERTTEYKWRILDLGTGSGCILISLLHELKNASGIGIDINGEALEIARSNAILNQVEDRATFTKGNWSAELAGPFDIIVSNPPYVPVSDKESLEKGVKEFDPPSALFAGEDGLDCYRILAPEFKRLLAPEGIGILEFGQGQCTAIKSIFTKHGFDVSFVAKDLAGIERIIGFIHKVSQNQRRSKSII